MRVVILNDRLERELFVALKQVRSLEASLRYAHFELRDARGGVSMRGVNKNDLNERNEAAGSESGPKALSSLILDALEGLGLSEGETMKFVPVNTEDPKNRGPVGGGS